MRIQMLIRSDAEKVFGTFYNASSSTMAADSVAQLLANSNGNSITTPTTAQLDLVIGIVNVAIATLTYGEVQVYGYRGTSAINTTTGTAGTAGDKLVPVAGATYLTRLAAGDGRDGLFAMAGTHATQGGVATATCSAKIFIRCM